MAIELDSGKSHVFKIAPRIFRVEPEQDDPTTPTKQFVNIDSTKPPRGRFITVEAYVAPRAPGWTVHFQVVRDPGNFDDTKLAADDRGGMEAVGAGTIAETTTATTDANGLAKARLRLSTRGGDKFKAKVATNAAMTGAKETGQFEVWRKVFAQVLQMKDSPSGTSAALDLANVVAQFRRSFIYLQILGKPEMVDYKALVDSAAIQTILGDRYSALKSPNQIAVLLGHMAALPFDQELSGSLASVPAPGNTLSFTINQAFQPYDAANWFKSGTITYTLKGDSEKTGNINQSLLSLVAVSGDAKKKRVKVDLNGIDLKVGSKLSVKLVVNKFQEVGVAFGGTPFLFIPVGSVNEGNWTSPSQNKTLMAEGITVHEVGHKVLMVKTNTKFFYTGEATVDGFKNPGKGTHCMHPDVPAVAGKYDPSGSHDCTMHHSTLGTRTFCDPCVDILRSNLLRGSDVNWNAPRGKDAKP